MSSPLTAISRWWFRPAPAERLAAVRILVGAFALVYLISRLPLWLGYGGMARRDFHPVGVIRLLDEPLPRALHVAIVIATGVLAIAFAAGAAYRVTAPAFAAALLWLTSYRNSWGMIFHTDNLLVLHACILAFAPAADAWSLDARRAHHAGPATPSPSPRFGWPLRLLAAVTVATYVIAGLAKLRLGGSAWLSGEALRDQIAVDNLRKVLLGSTASPFATPLLHHPWLFQALAVMTLVVELGAPIALVGGRPAQVWAIAAWGFHLGVLALMAIVFPYPLSGVGYAPFFAVERPLAWIARTAGRRHHR